MNQFKATIDINYDYIEYPELLFNKQVALLNKKMKTKYDEKTGELTKEGDCPTIDRHLVIMFSAGPHFENGDVDSIEFRD